MAPDLEAVDQRTENSLMMADDNGWDEEDDEEREPLDRPGLRLIPVGLKRRQLTGRTRRDLIRAAAREILALRGAAQDQSP